MSNKVYDVLKYIALVACPAVCTLVAAIAVIWQIPHTDEIVATLAAINTFIGSLVVYNKAKYDKEMKENAEKDKED